jgi:hypothetical protein
MYEETHPPCKHCGHTGLSHDEEFGNCLHRDYGSPHECECPGYDPMELIDLPCVETIQ